MIILLAIIKFHKLRKRGFYMIEIKIKKETLLIYTPYNAKFVSAIKKIGGAKWDSVNKCWTAPEEFLDAVREIMTEVYGYSDISKNESISLKLTFNEEVKEDRADVVLFGKILSHATGRDSGARVGDDVAMVKGDIGSGGSVKNWVSVIKEGSTFILKNVNKNIFEKEKDGIKYNISIEIVDNAKKSKTELLEEKKRLLERIKEIDELLKEE